MRKRTSIERLTHSKNQLSEFLKLSKNELAENYTTLLIPAISRIYRVIYENNEVDTSKYTDSLNLKTDYLMLDIQLIAYYFEDIKTIRYIPYRNVSKLSYPHNYEVIDAKIGKFKSLSSNDELFSRRIAIDFALLELAQKWHKQIPKIMDKLF